VIRYCDDCKKPAWPKTNPSYMGWYKCVVCGKVTWCHEGPDHLIGKKEKKGEVEEEESET
jgi:hypothetical protein